MYKHALLSGLYGRGQRTVEYEDDQIAVDEPELLPNSLAILQKNYGITANSLGQEINVGQKMLRKILPIGMIENQLPDPVNSNNVLFGNFRKVST